MGASNDPHILGTLVPVEEPFTASQADFRHAASQRPSFFRQMPNAVPIGRWRGITQQGDTLEEELRWAILHIGAKAAFEVGLRLFPILSAIGGQTARELIAQRALLWLKLAGVSHRLVDADRLGLPGDGDGVELTRLDDLLGEPIGLLAEDDRGAIELVVDALDSAG